MRAISLMFLERTNFHGDQSCSGPRGILGRITVWNISVHCALHRRSGFGKRTLFFWASVVLSRAKAEVSQYLLSLSTVGMFLKTNFKIGRHAIDGRAVAQLPP